MLKQRGHSEKSLLGPFSHLYSDKRVSKQSIFWPRGLAIPALVLRWFLHLRPGFGAPQCGGGKFQLVPVQHRSSAAKGVQRNKFHGRNARSL